jgi:hypothetical protein
MASITISASGTAQIPGRGGRKGLIMTAKTGTAVYGFESNVSTSGATEGLVLPASPASVYISEPSAAGATIYLASAAGATVLYTELL